MRVISTCASPRLRRYCSMKYPCARRADTARSTYGTSRSRGLHPVGPASDAAPRFVRAFGAAFFAPRATLLPFASALDIICTYMHTADTGARQAAGTTRRTTDDRDEEGPRPGTSRDGARA